MRKRHKLLSTFFMAALLTLVAGLGSYALAQSDDAAQPPAAGSDEISRHVDYDVTLQVNGDLSAVDPKLTGILPLNLNAKGGADIGRGENGPEVNGNLQVTGLDAIIQKIAAENGAGDARAALGAGIVQSALSDLQFVAVDNDMYVKLAGTWYNTGDMSKQHGCKPDGDSENVEANADENGAGGANANDANEAAAGEAKDKDHACAESAFPGGPEALLKDVRTVGQEDIDGIGTTHYQATVDLDKAITEGATAARNCGKTDEAARIEAARGQLTGAVKQLNLEWWLDGDNQLRQARAAVAMEPASLATLLASLDSSGHGADSGTKDAAKETEARAKADAALKGIQSITINATVKFSRFGEDFQIARPGGDIKPLSELMGATCGQGQKGQRGQNKMHGHRNGNSDGSGLSWHRDDNSGQSGEAATQTAT
ncbi:MAG: hypothetical protein ACYDGS_02405 [Thermoleophilia bacterium]